MQMHVHAVECRGLCREAGMGFGRGDFALYIRQRASGDEREGACQRQHGSFHHFLPWMNSL